MPVLLGCGQMGHAAICRKYPSKVKFKERCNHHTESILKGATHASLAKLECTISYAQDVMTVKVRDWYERHGQQYITV